ncbi:MULTISPECIES: glycosyltransferase family 2 protein [unclassified Providencia]|uniref:glycosyltransferase family 2 protein n=1 Tax=unclassified Providencia TaxID=2633465 RepID=UPI00234B67CA|nr:MULTISPECIES: glycosyltransferase family 2 protein [unclassified Providencia]HBK4773417.1 glycosyltransferase family 2 protein [Providencia rettgeri]
MNQEIFFSIIVPIYNSQEFILDTLKSISNINYKNFEVLLVNDGSTDNTELIISNYIKDDSRFRLLQQVNSGPNIARNLAIDNAKGEYLLFLDSDDIFKKNLLSKLNAILTNNQYDLINFGYEFKNFKKNKVISKSNFKNQVLHNESILKSSFLPGGISGVCWNKCFRKDLILKNKIYFTPDRMHGRDILFSRSFSYYSTLALIIPDILVISRYRNGSYSRNFSEKNIESAIDLVKKHKIIFSGKLSNSQINDLNIAIARHLRYIHILNAFRTKNHSEFLKNHNLLLKNSKTEVKKSKNSFKLQLIDQILNHPNLLRIICVIMKKFGYQPY